MSEVLKSVQLTQEPLGSPSKKLKVDGETENDDEIQSIARAPVKAFLRVAKLTDQAFIPSRASSKAAGYDLYSAYDYEIQANNGKCVCKTDIQLSIPSDCYGRVAPRSGLAAKHFIDVGAGVIDADYRGNVGVLLFNFGKEAFTVKRGDRIAQLLLERIYTPEVVECENLDETQRGAGGFGSTGR